MAWAKLDDQFFYNKKIAQVDGPAKLLYIASLVYTANQLTDGFIPERAVKFIASTADVANCQEFAKQLLDVGLWDATDDGYQIHDFLEWNPSKEQVEQTREARAASGRRGGLAKAANAKQTASKPLAKEQQKSAPSPSPSPSLVNDDNQGNYLESVDVEDRAEALTPGPVVARASTTRTTVKPNSKVSKQVNIFAAVTGFYPARQLHHLIDSAIDEDADQPFLKQCFETWLSRGYRKENIAWLTEWYTSGSIPPAQRNNNGNGKGAPADPLQAYSVDDLPAHLRAVVKS